jgi:hypothetical protein
VDPYIYKTYSDLDDMLAGRTHKYDQWYFSGILNYSYVVKNKLIQPDIANYPQLYGSSFIEALLQAQLRHGKIYKSFSVDTFSTEEMESILRFNSLEDLTFYNSPWRGHDYIPDLIEFHKEQYESGRAEIAITPIQDICLALREEEIPVVRATPSYLAIKFSLELLLERAQANRYKNAQMAVIGFRTVFGGAKDDDVHYSFKLRNRELDFKRVLLHFTEKVNGSFMQLGDGLFFIFTTRGEIGPEREKDLFMIMEEARLQSNIDVTVSIGYGETALQAENHVRYGFQHNREMEASLTVVEEDHSVVVKHAADESFSYRPVQLGAAWIKKLNNVSPAVVAKIEAAVQQYGKSEFSPQDIARWLQSTDRNGRRIVSEMLKAEIIEVCGEMQSASRGRPRKLYRFITGEKIGSDERNERNG